MSRYIYLSHYSDRYEILVDGPRILRINKLFSDSGIIRRVEFSELPNGLQDEVIRKMDAVNYEI